MYQALYRKYRPRSFSDVVGQEHITQTLRSQVAANKLTHAYLFIGTRGTGKTTCAKILSRAVNCLNPVDGNPCNECSSCIGINDGSILDVLEIDAASNNGVENIRELREEAVYLPAAVNKRVYILDEAHMLSIGAVNALLKILEEPPGHVVFILATTELNKVPATIQSRCQKFSFRRLTLDEITQRLKYIAKNEGLDITDEAAQRLSMLADGSMRDGVSLLDQCVTTKTIDLDHVLATLGLPAEYELLKMVEGIAQNDAITVLGILDTLYKDGKDMAGLLNELSGILRDLIVIGLDPQSSLLSSGITPQQLSAMSKKISTERLFYCLEIAKNTGYSIARTGITKLTLEMCLVRMCNEHLSDTPAAMLSRIANLEEGKQIPAPLSASASTAAPKPKTAAAPPPEPVRETPPPAIEPKQESKPEPEEKPKAKPEAAAKTAQTAQTRNTLSKVLEHIDDGSLLTYFEDPSQAWGEYDDGMLTIKMTNSFSAGMVKSTFMDTLNEAAGKAYGEKVNVRIEVASIETDSTKKSKLDDLQAFDIVKIE